MNCHGCGVELDPSREQVTGREAVATRRLSGSSGIRSLSIAPLGPCTGIVKCASFHPVSSWLMALAVHQISLC